jgi:hypothetical protein
MKRFFVLFSILIMGIVFVSFTLSRATSTADSAQMPDNVKAAIDKSCFGCHNTASQNAKAKDKLDFSTLSSLPKAGQIGKYREIGETIKNGEMPPKKFLDNNPDKKLTAEESKLLIKWAEGEVKNLMKK